MVGAVNELAERIRSARRLAVVTGAGVSAASGVPTFRGPQGMWKRYRPEDLATADAFAADPRLVWEWYEWRRTTIAGCRPNAAHDVLARWSRERPGVRVITQNVDDLHLRAGTENLIRLHGSIWELSCWNRCAAAAWRDKRTPLPELPPRCPTCGGLARPAVVWFGESLNPADVDAAHDASACEVFLTVGTSAIVYPAAAFLHRAKTAGAFTAEINLEETPASELVDIAIHEPAEDVLVEIDMVLAGTG